MPNTSISFVVAAYNIEKYIDACMASVLEAATTGDEIIVVNDGSTDHTSQRIATHQGSSVPVHVVNKKNGGLSSARNAGLAAATKPYILFVDGDDVINPATMHALRAPLSQHQPDILVTDHHNWLNDGAGPIEPSLPRSHQPGTLTHDPLRQLSETLDDCIPCVWARIFRRDLFQALGSPPFPEWSMYDDLPTTPHLVAAAKTMLYLPQPLMKYRCRPGSLTKSRTERSCTDMVKATTHAAKSIRRLAYDAELETTCDVFIARKFLEAIRQSREVPKPTLDFYRSMTLEASSALSNRKLALLLRLRRSTRKSDKSVMIHIGMAMLSGNLYASSQALIGKYKSRRHQ
jgi:Glycosyl transferase family 2